MARPRKDSPGKWDKYWKFEGSRFKSESQWFTYLRSNIRKGWNTHFMKIKKLMDGRKKIPNPNPKTVKRFPEIWGADCEVCSGTFPLSAGKVEGKNTNRIVVDHKIEAGSFKDVSDFQAFFTRMFLVTEDDLRLCCTHCNKTLAHASKRGISFEEAVAERKALEIIKDKKDKEFLEAIGIVPGKL